MTDQNQITLQKGFSDPVDGAGQTFRAILNVLSRPGTVVEIDGPAEIPEGLSNAAAAILLTLADYATPAWLSDTVATHTITSYVRFHTNAPITANTEQSMFAVWGKEAAAFSAGIFNPGTPQYPDRSTTVIIEVDGFDEGPNVKLSGPGIDGTTHFQVGGVPKNFWAEMQQNNALFPLGVDVIFAGRNQLAALPRSTRIEVI